MTGFERIDAQRWRVYFDERDKGSSVERSARMARINPSSAYRFESGDPRSSGHAVAAELNRTKVGGKDVPFPVPVEAKRCLEDFSRFRLRYFGRWSTPWQTDAATKIVKLLETADREFLVVNLPPGSGKSTLMTHDVPAWVLARDRARRIQFGSRTERQARMYVSRLKRTLERDAPLRTDGDSLKNKLAVDAKATMAGDYGAFQPEGRSDLWRADGLVVRQLNGMASDDKEPSVSAWGQDSGFLGGRFDLVVWDDLVDRKNTRGKEAADKLVDWWMTEAETRLEPGGLLVLQGQRMGPDDLYRTAIDMTDYEGRPKYHVVRYPAHDQGKCTNQHEDLEPWPASCLLDPVRLPWRMLSAIQATDPRVFDVQYQQNDGDATSQLVEMAWIEGGPDTTGAIRPGCLDLDRVAGKTAVAEAHVGWSVVTVDPSPSEFWGVIWWLMRPEANRFEIVDLWRQRMGSERFLSMDLDTFEFSGLLEEIRSYSSQIGHPLGHVVVEVNAAQKYLLSQPHVVRWGQAHQVTFLPHTTSVNKADPEYGVTSIADFFRQGAVRIPHGDAHTRAKMRQLIHELTTWPDARTDDLVMSTWFGLRAVTMQAFASRAQSRRFERPAWLRGRTRGLAHV